MVSVLSPGLCGLGSSPGLDVVSYSWESYFTLALPLSTQMYRCVPVNLKLGCKLETGTA